MAGEKRDYSGSSQVYGGRRERYPWWYGTNRSFLYRDNRINGSGTSVLSANTDSREEALWYVIRHNYWKTRLPTAMEPKADLGAASVHGRLQQHVQPGGQSPWRREQDSGLERGYGMIMSISAFEPGNRHHNRPVFRQVNSS
jgi:hypothetical protein